MRCQGCGAVMKLAPTRDHFACEFCGGHAFPTRSVDGLAVLGEETQLPCPLCKQHLVHGTLETHPVEHCERCEGFLVAQRDFGLALRLRRAWQEKNREPLPRKPIDPAALERRIPCPRCKKVMYTEPYLGPGGVVLDTCLACERIWLDRGEFSVLERA